MPQNLSQTAAPQLQSTPECHRSSEAAGCNLSLHAPPQWTSPSPGSQRADLPPPAHGDQPSPSAVQRGSAPT